MEGLLIAKNMARTADLAHHFLEAVDQAAIASAAWRGLGDKNAADAAAVEACLLYTSPSPRDRQNSRMPSPA